MLRYFMILFFTTSLAIVAGSCNAQKVNATQPPNMKLSNEWVLDGFFDADGKLVFDQTKKTSITISPDQTFITGNTGCNAMRGPVKADENGKIKIGPVESGRKKCTDTESEKKLMEALECTTDYKIEGAVLKLFCNEKPVVQFESYRN